MALKNLAKLVAEANKEKTPAQEFLYLFNEATVRLDEPRKPSQSYKPSSLGGCMRNMYYQIMGAEVDHRKLDANFIGIGESGTDRHERIQTTITKMKELGYDVEYIDVGDFVEQRKPAGTRVVKKQGMETKLYNDILDLSFLCDGIIKFKGKYYILEIKTEVSFKWQPRTQPDPKHIVQATAYSTALGVNLVMFLYENRDFCSKKTFVHEVTEQDKQQLVVHEIETCNTYVEHKHVPPMTTKKSDCKYCAYKTVCKLDGETQPLEV